MYSLLRLLIRTRWARYGTALILLLCAAAAVAGALASPPDSRANNYAAAAIFIVLALAAAAAGVFLPAAKRHPQPPVRAGGYGASVVGSPDRSREREPQ